jgi:hypothetical protein
MQSYFRFIMAMALFSMPLSPALSQAYDEMQSRFVRPVLGTSDSNAFRMAGEQKVRQLLEQSDFHSRNVNVTSNQAYVVNRSADLFYTDDTAPIDYDALLQAIAQARMKSPRAPRLVTQPAPGYLGVVRTQGWETQFTFYLMLQRTTKSFGAEQEEVWQVFLTRPEIKTP